MLITILMICVIMALIGCTRFDTEDRVYKDLILEFTSKPNGECIMSIDFTHDDSLSDESLDIKHPTRGNKD